MLIKKWFFTELDADLYATTGIANMQAIDNHPDAIFSSRFVMYLGKPLCTEAQLRNWANNKM